MADLNEVALIGRLVRDAELAYTTSGTAACKFSIAVSKTRKVGEGWEDYTSFFDVVLWGKKGESLSKYLLKGKQVAVAGELNQERWQSNGQNRSRVVIVADAIQLFAGGNSGGENKELFPPSSDAPPSDTANGSYTDDIPF